MAGDRNFITSLIISLFIHGILIVLIPGLRPLKPEDVPIGSYTRVQLIQVPVSPNKRNRQTIKAGGKIPVPEMDEGIKNRLNEIRDVSFPFFDLALPQQKELPSLSHQDLIFEEEVLLEEKMMEEMEQASPMPQPIEVVAKREESFSKPPLEELDFDVEQFVDEVIEDVSHDDMDIEWSGKPRQIVDKPLHSPTYPPGYEGQLEGKIRLKFWVDTDGHVIRIQPMQILDARLVAVAWEHLRQYRFEPLSKDQGREPEWGIIPFSFRLK